MGYMTVVSVLNDGWPFIEKHPDQFVRNIFDGMTGSGKSLEKLKMVNSYPVGNHCNPMQVAKSFHADCPQIFYVGQNSMTMLTDWTAKNKDDIEAQLKQIKSAKSMLNHQEKELKKKLQEFDRLHVGESLLCKSDYVERCGQDEMVLLKTGFFYRILNMTNIHAIFEAEEERMVGIPILELEQYFDIKK